MNARFVDRHGAAIRDFGPGIDIVIQRFGDEAVAVAHRRGIERRRLAIRGVADAVERLAVGESRGEAQVDAAEHVLREAFDEAHHFRHGSDRRLTHTELEREQEHQFGVGRAATGIEKLVVEHGFHCAAQALETADLAVMHEGPVFVRKGMAIVAAGAAAGGGAHMREKKRRADLPRKALQIAIGPGGKDIAISARLRPVAIPGDAEAIAIGGGLGAGGAMGLLDQRMRGRGYQLLQIEGVSAIGCPATHALCSSLPSWRQKMPENTRSDCRARW
ncbi:conserved hypothetical protein [Ricinus communis]|uniref:Uncharacterized protein n=1 Tax=Ricinus communis TaxID=3988 RepID=B9TME5_RICCO|nr:conserved hypothetical protein [Ricinus communis]